MIGVIDPKTLDRVTKRPRISEFSIADNGGNRGSVPEGLAPDGHGNIWFTDDGAVKTIGMMSDPDTTGAMTEANQTGAGLSGQSAPIGILLISKGPAKGLWFTDQLPSPRVGVMTASRMMSPVSFAQTKWLECVPRLLAIL